MARLSVEASPSRRSPVIRSRTNGQNLTRIVLTQGGKPIPVTETRDERGRSR